MLGDEDSDNTEARTDVIISNPVASVNLNRELEVAGMGASREEGLAEEISPAGEMRREEESLARGIEGSLVAGGMGKDNGSLAEGDESLSGGGGVRNGNGALSGGETGGEEVEVTVVVKQEGEEEREREREGGDHGREESEEVNVLVVEEEVINVLLVKKHRNEYLSSLLGFLKGLCMDLRLFLW